MVGLFALVWGIMLVIELVVFPPNLMSDWPNLEDPTVGFVDLVRTGAFISTIGVLSGALAGGLENRAIVSHLALFLDRPQPGRSPGSRRVPATIPTPSGSGTRNR